ncbi:hypothetical protein IP91_00278 [Pseudoduganella lurida]|uniref:Uncharacterized protein n=1 Tax=Pseudoduganella lurida TaxID=1036180 RepID=A0A562RJF5_9BURK|nr:hypothetical protein [Pseudoduganella lurida]TWI69212.1 hypothetical protein IP91_00278 [Pseudoduganella lurida]
MQINPHYLSIFAAALAFSSAASAAQVSVGALEGEYDLATSNTVPASNWGYTKGRISVRKLDDQHVVILMACGWKREPKAQCSDFYFAQGRDGGVYLQDMNTDWMRLYFDPASRKLTIISRGFDAKGSVRRDVFAPTTAPLTDPDLVRRLKREEKLYKDKENVRVFGPYTRWEYKNNRIEFQNP